MRLLCLRSVAPSEVRQAAGGRPGSGWWLDHAFSDLRNTGIPMRVLYPEETGRGELDDKCSYATFRRPDRHKYDPAMEAFFRQELQDFQPDVIHIWGTEYAHTLAMLRACEKAGLLDRTAVSIQGLCTACARHYTEGIPYAVQRRFTFRDFLRQDNILQQQKKYALRGEMETKALQITHHIIGRTDWDRACTGQMAPQAQYHFCNETLREPLLQAPPGQLPQISDGADKAVPAGGQNHVSGKAYTGGNAGAISARECVYAALHGGQLPQFSGRGHAFGRALRGGGRGRCQHHAESRQGRIPLPFRRPGDAGL